MQFILSFAFDEKLIEASGIDTCWHKSDAILENRRRFVHNWLQIGLDGDRQVSRVEAEIVCVLKATQQLGESGKKQSSVEQILTN